MVCRHCGAPLKPGANFCGKCGAKVEPEIQQETPKKRKNNPLLWVGLGVCIVVIVALVIVIVMMMWNRNVNRTGQNSGYYVAESNAESNVKGQSEASPEQQESLEEQESSMISALPEKIKTVRLSCGAEVALDATALDLSDFYVNDLQGLEQCTDLQYLKIDGGKLTDLTPVLTLGKLQTLVIHHVPLQEIGLLRNLTSLTYLDIKDTKVTADMVQAYQTAVPGVTVEGYRQSTYELVAQNCTWDEAKRMCEAAGGHLVTIEDEAEMQKVLTLLQGTQLSYLWLGAYCENGQWSWVTGEPWGGYQKWYAGEPSGQDVDGTPENRLCLWNIDEAGWTMNDQRSDLSSFKHAQGRLGYICETEKIAGFKE